MELTRCTGCMELIPEGEVRYAFDEAYCERCFDDRFTYCCQCDRLLSREDVQWDRDGDPYCSECFEEENDDESPDNPEVYDADRQLIVELSRGFLAGRLMKRSLIKINKNDILLTKLRDKIGIVEHPVYVYGLIDREEYQLSVSSNFIDDVKEYILLNGLGWKVNPDSGVNRIGVSLSLRKNNLEEVTQLIIQTTRSKILCAV